MTPRFIIAPLFWLVLSIASLVAAFSVWQADRLVRMRPPAVVAPPESAEAAPPEPVREPERALPVARRAPASAAEPSFNPPQAPRELDPTTDRLVLRCTIKGRVTYRDLNAGCPDGAAEKMTVFPTDGVGRPK